MIELELAISPFLLLGAALPGAINLGQSLLNKPKEEDFRPNTAGMERFRAYLRGRTASSEVAHQALQPQLSAIGQQTRQTERKIQSAVGRGDLSASEEAQIQISQGQAASSVAQQAGEAAFEAQRQENRRVGQQVAQIEANIAQAKEQAKIDYERATKQHRQQVTGAALQLGAGVASAGISSHLQAVAASKSALDAGLAAGTVAAGTTAKELGAKALEAGFTNPSQYINMLGNQQKVTQSFSQFGKDEISAAAQKLYGTDQFDIGKDLSLGGAQDLMKELGQGRGQLARELQTKIFEGEDVDLTQYSGRLGEQTLSALTTQKLTKQDSLVDPSEIAFSTALESTDLNTLRSLRSVEGRTDKELAKIDARIGAVTNANIKAVDAKRKQLVKDKKLPQGSPQKMKNFDASLVGLKHKMAQSFDSLDGEDRTALNIFKKEVDALDGKYALSRQDGEKLSNIARAFVGSLSEQGKVDMAATILGGSTKAGTGGENISNKLIAEIQNLITNSVDLTPAQWDEYDRALLGNN